MSGQLFLDANAHLPINQAGLKVYNDVSNSIAGHGHAMSSSFPGREASRVIEESRAKIAHLIGAKDHNQIVFTNTCTQACEWALNILKSKFPKAVASPIEHPAVKHHFHELFGNNEFTVEKTGRVGCEYSLQANTAAVCLHVQNEIGTIQPIENIGGPLFSDMSQSLGKIKINVNSFNNLYLAAFGAHKYGGPASVGFMYLKDTDWWREFGTGSRYFTDRTGTPDAPSIAAAAAALEYSLRNMQERYERALRFKTILEDAVENLGLNIVAKDAVRVPHVTFVQVKKRMGPYLISQLETEGIYIGLGSACGAMHAGPSPIMTALGYGGHSHDFIRISNFGEYGEYEAKQVAAALKKYCPKVDYVP